MTVVLSIVGSSTLIYGGTCGAGLLLERSATPDARMPFQSLRAPENDNAAIEEEETGLI